MKVPTHFVVGALIVLMFSQVYAEESIDFAAIYALTGPAAENDRSSLLGLKIGVDEINERGGIFGKQLKLLILDNQSTPIGSSIAAEKAATANVVGILGAAWSSHSLSIARVAHGKGIPMVTNYSTHPAVTDVGDYIFRVCFNDRLQGKVMAQFAHSELQASTALIFTNLHSDYSTELSRIFRENFEKLGGKVLSEIEYKPNQLSYADQIAEAKKILADVVFLSGHDESGLIAKMLQDAGVQAIPLGGDGWAEDSFLSRGGKALKRAYYCSHWSEESDSPLSRAFVTKYRDLENFGTGTALAYDAVMLLASAIERANSLERKKIRDALADTLAFEGVTGKMYFREKGDPVKSAVIMQIADGVPRYLKTLEP